MGKQHRGPVVTTATIPQPPSPSPSAPVAAEPDSSPPKALRGEPVPGAAVGLGVQYHQAGAPVAAVLTRQNLGDPSLWDLALILPGVAGLSNRAAVPFSESPKERHWNFITG